MKTVKKDEVAVIILISVIRLSMNVLIAMNLDKAILIIPFELLIIFSWLGYLQNLFFDVFEIGPQIPEIQYGKFPFEIVYSVDGEIYEVNDVFACKYEGIDYRGGEKKLKWNTYLENSGESYLKLCDVEKSGQLQSICLDLGNVNYYMLSDEKDENYSPGEYVFNIRYPRKPISLEDAKKDYDIEIISAKFSDPIENEFEYRTVDKIRLFLFGGGKEDN